MPRPLTRRRLLRSCATFLVLLGGVVASSQLAGVSGTDRAADATLVFGGEHERWLVQVPGGEAAVLERAADEVGGGVAGAEVGGEWREVTLEEAAAAADVEDAFGEIGATAVEPALPRVLHDEPQMMEDPARVTTRSPLAAARIGEQWAIDQAGDVDLDAPEAWRRGLGAGAVVAVLDTGVDPTHPDLVGRVLPGRDFTGSSTGPSVDVVGHGTHVASVIAGNGTTMSGIAPGARILPLKIYRDSELGFSMTAYLAAIRYAADRRVDVINLSIGCGGTPKCFSQAEFEALQYATSRGVLVVASAGNGDEDGRPVDIDSPLTPDYPSNYDDPSILSVTSIGRSGSWSPWSNYGLAGVDFAAPGEEILVASTGHGHEVVDGTSFAVPYAAGIAALVASRNPAASAAELRAALEASVVRHASLARRTSSGGRVNAAAAVAHGEAVRGGGPAATAPGNGIGMRAPRARARLQAPPVLSWALPPGWRSVRIMLGRGSETRSVKVASRSRALAHPAVAWRSGTYRWQVVARNAAGRLVKGPVRSYRLAPRLGAWVSSGMVRGNGRTARLRIGYAASESTARVRVVVRVGTRVVHSGRNVVRKRHQHGIGSPRRAWFRYDARLTRGVRAGQRITVEVRVVAGGRALTRRFRARVA